ncbi:MAG TPA: right-handed parallel beta-helix repeat-containing protein [Parafilimonas sp.]|nr:right-handed parallel beta-helix repeat-containing protein [Parafilimonas sp.]
MKRTSKIIVPCFCFFIFFNTNIFSQGRNYYVATAGNDNNNGLTPATAWRSIDKINAVDFKPGDSVFFEGSAVFNGAIKLTSDDNGTAGKPIVFTSYGKDRATINAGDDEGLLAVNTSFVKLVSLNFEGLGVNTNKGSGIHFFANDSLNMPSHIEIDGCDVKGFNTYGIVFGANDDIAYKGYKHVRITHCNASGNGQGGIASYGSYKGFQHKDFYIAYCKAFENRGILTKTENHSGNGIVMAMIDGLVIEHCEAYENGADNRCNAGGPVGIWVWMCKNATIQYCVSHDNHTGTVKDGGGFDIDGGASNCVLQYNYSYNNEGAGYLLAEYGALFLFTNNIIRFNISVNDGRKNNYGAVSIWGADSAYSVTNSYVYNNTIYLDDKNLVGGIPAAVTFIGPNFKNVIIANNIFVTKGNVNFINSDLTINTAAAYFLHNNYYSYSNQYVFKYGPTTFFSLQEWLENNADQERTNSEAVHLNIDPLFNNISFNSTDKKGFMLQKNSLLRKKTFLLPDYFAITGTVKDIGNNTLPLDKKVFPGAFIK